MGFLGGLIGKGLGWLGEKALGKTKGIDGESLGENLGSRFIPFQAGGMVQRAGMPAMMGVKTGRVARGYKKGGKVKKANKNKKSKSK